MNCLNCCLSCHNNQFSLVLSTELIFVTGVVQAGGLTLGFALHLV